MEYHVAPSYQNWNIKQIDEARGKALVSQQCWKCGGSGVYAWFGTCFACNGTGRDEKWVKIYTDDEYAKYIKQQERNKERRAEAAAKKMADLQANSESNRVAALESFGYNPENPLVYIVGGKSTFEIKDWLKEHGFKFHKDLTWYTTHETEVPEGYVLGTLPFNEVFDWDCYGKRFYFKSEAKEAADALLKSLLPPSNSEWMGEEKERLRDIPVTLVSKREFESQWGTSHIYTFKHEDNVLVWFSTAWKDVEVGNNYLLTGTVKSHGEYNGEKQTNLSRCIIKEVG